MDTPCHAAFASRAERIGARIAEAERRAGRSAGSVGLIAVSKKQTQDRIEAALAHGLTVFGESRVQEAKEKWGRRDDRSTSGIIVHMVGPLQSNKVRDSVAIFDVIQSLDRPKLAKALAEAGTKTGMLPSIMVQVNTGEEPHKSGILPQEADAFIASARDEFDLPLIGAMCIPPLEEAAGPHFALLARIAERNGLAQLSMGMSNDFETAIAFGAHRVRIGSALFGPRTLP